MNTSVTVETACSLDPSCTSSPGSCSPGGSSCDTTTSFPGVLAAAIPYAEAIVSNHALPSSAILRQLRKQQAAAACQRLGVSASHHTSSSSCSAVSRLTDSHVPCLPTPAPAVTAAAAAQSSKDESSTPQQQQVAGEASYDQAMSLLTMALQQRPALSRLLAIAGPAKGAKLLTRLLQARSGVAPGEAFTALMEQELARLAAEGRLPHSSTVDPQQQQEGQEQVLTPTTSLLGGGLSPPPGGALLAASRAGSHGPIGSVQLHGGTENSMPAAPLLAASPPGDELEGSASVRLVQVLQTMLRSGQLSPGTRQMLLGRLQARAQGQQQQQQQEATAHAQGRGVQLQPAATAGDATSGPPGRPPLPLHRSSSLPGQCVTPPLPPPGWDGNVCPQAGVPWQVGASNPQAAPVLRAGSVPGRGWFHPGEGPPRRLHPLPGQQQPMLQERRHTYGGGSSRGGPPLPPGFPRLQGMPLAAGGLPLRPLGCLPPPLRHPPGPAGLHMANTHPPPPAAGGVGGPGAMSGVAGSSLLPPYGMVGGPMALRPLFRGQQQQQQQQQHAPGRAGRDMPPPALSHPPVSGGFVHRAMPPAPVGNMQRHPPEMLPAGGFLPPQHALLGPHNMQQGPAAAGAAAGSGSSRRGSGQVKRTHSAMEDAVTAAVPAKVPATPRQRVARLAPDQTPAVGGVPPPGAPHWAPAPAPAAAAGGAGVSVDPTLLDTLLEMPSLDDLDLMDLEGLGDPLSGPLLGVLDDLPPLELGDFML